MSPTVQARFFSRSRWRQGARHSGGHLLERALSGSLDYAVSLDGSPPSLWRSHGERWPMVPPAIHAKTAPSNPGIKHLRLSITPSGRHRAVGAVRFSGCVCGFTADEKPLETKPRIVRAHATTKAALRNALEAAGDRDWRATLALVPTRGEAASVAVRLSLLATVWVVARGMAGNRRIRQISGRHLDQPFGLSAGDRRAACWP